MNVAEGIRRFTVVLSICTGFAAVVWGVLLDPPPVRVRAETGVWRLESGDSPERREALKRFREKYPMYRDISDSDLVEQIRLRYRDIIKRLPDDEPMLR